MDSGLMEIELTFDRCGIRDGKVGCWRARLAHDHSVHDAGASKEEAISNLLVTAGTREYSNKPSDYSVVRPDLN